MIIRGEKVFLRPIRPSDFPKLAAWSRDREIARYVGGQYPTRLEEYAEWHRRLQSDRHSHHLAISTHDDVLIGHIELDHIAWRSGDAELRIRIGERQHWGRGYGTEAVRLLLSHAFSSLNLKRVYLRVFSFNERAIRCYRKAGFRREGMLVRRAPDGQRRTVLLMRILRDEFLRQPSHQARAS